MPTPPVLFIGTNRHIVAVNSATGQDLWRTKLPKVGWGSGPVSLLVTPEVLFAGCGGYLFALDRESGEILWRNNLSGLGHDYVIMTTDGLDSQQARAQQMLLDAIADAQAKQAAVAAAGAG